MAYEILGARKPPGKTKKRRWSFFAVCAVVLLGSVRAGAEDTNQPIKSIRGPVAVMALVSEADTEETMLLAGEVHAALDAEGKLKVLAAEDLKVLLGGADSTGSGDMDLERLEGLFQKGYIQSYSFEYNKALDTLAQVAEGLDKLPSGSKHWELWIKTCTFQGISYMGLGEKQKALRAFQQVLRTRPDMRLKSIAYSPKVIGLWERAKRELSDLDKGQLGIESEPSGIQVALDGVVMGKTPFIHRLPLGSYHLQLEHPKHGKVTRRIEIGREPLRLRYQMSFEGSLVLDRAHAYIRVPNGKAKLPAHWWPWLGARLGLRYLVTVQKKGRDKQPQMSAALIDLERGRKVREGWLEPSGLDITKMRQDATDLADFLTTGRVVDRLQVRESIPIEDDLEVAMRLNKYGSPMIASAHAGRPWYRSWWPYAAAGGAFLATGIVGLMQAADFDSMAKNAKSLDKKAEYESNADTWKGLSITGFCLTAAAAAIGTALYLTYDQKELPSQPEVIISAMPTGIVLSGRF